MDLSVLLDKKFSKLFNAATLVELHWSVPLVVEADIKESLYFLKRYEAGKIKYSTRSFISWCEFDDDKLLPMEYFLSAFWNKSNSFVIFRWPSRRISSISSSLFANWTGRFVNVVFLVWVESDADIDAFLKKNKKNFNLNFKLEFLSLFVFALSVDWLESE